MSDLISWTSAFETGLPTVDEQHRELVRLTNRLGVMLTEADRLDPAEIDNAFAELANYAKYHFAEEEGLMDKAGLPDKISEEHKRDHGDFVEKIAELWTGRHDNPEKTLAAILVYLQTWTYKHIVVVDKEMARCIAAEPPIA